MIIYREYTVEDIPFLREMLFEAVFWSREEEEKPTLEEGLSYDYTKHILEGFGTRKGDIAVIAEMNSKRVGVAFIRYWDDVTNMRGYMSPDIPVLVVGVEKAYRRKGIAKDLIDFLKHTAVDHGISKISLCVTKSNIAYSLYLKSHFKIIEDIESSYIMLWENKKDEYKVTQDRESETSHPIKLLKGELVECVEASDENGEWAGWIYCKGEAKEGWVPRQIIKQQGKTGLILENYDATEFDLRVGEVIVADKILNGWIYGTKKGDEGLKAWAPLNHLERI